MSRFVQRDLSGNIVGYFANFQPGYAEEELPDDNLELVNYIFRRHTEDGRVDTGTAVYDLIGFTRPGVYYDPVNTVSTGKGGIIVVTRTWEPWAQARVDAKQGIILDARVEELDNVNTLERAVLQVILDEFNTHSARLSSLLSAVAAATSLADLKTRVAATVTAIPQRTLLQLRTAVRNKLGT